MMFQLLPSVCVAFLLVQADPAKPEAGKQEPRCDLSLHLSPGGGVDLTLRQVDKATEKSVEKVYKADSMDQFTKTYPEVAKKYRIDRILQGDAPPRQDSRDLGKKGDEWNLTFDQRWFWGRSRADDVENWFGELPKALQTDDLRRWVEGQRAGIEKSRHPNTTVDPDRGAGEGPSPARPLLGVLIAPVGDTLASQLGFKKVEGIIFASVKKDSLAERSGLRINDIGLKINGKEIPDTAFFQNEVSNSTKELVVEILRQGKHETITIQFEK